MKKTFLLLLAFSALILSLPVIFPVDTGNNSLWIEFIGSFHPLFLHLPIGFLLLIFALEVIGVVFRVDYKSIFQVSLILNALAAFFAALLGFILYQTGGWSGELIDSHLWQGLIFAVVAVWLPFIYYIYQKKKRIIFQAALVISVGILFSAAHKGGELTHGDPLDKAPWKVKKKEKKKLEDLIIYEDIIAPILEQKCYTCHDANKQRGGLRLDSIAAMLKGGKDVGPSLIIGDAENSTLVSFIKLPVEDELHMPPENKPQITPAELALIEWWVNIGAPSTQTVSEFELSTSLKESLDEVLQNLGTAKLQAESQQQGIIKDEDYLSNELKELSQKVEIILNKYPATLAWNSLDDRSLNFTAASIRKNYHDEDLKALDSIADKLKVLNLNGTKVSNQLGLIAKKLNNLEVLKLAETPITDKNIKKLKGLTKLTVLNLHSTSITDASIKSLTKLKKLEKLYLWNTKITDKGIDKLSKSLPACQIISGISESLNHPNKLVALTVDKANSSQSDLGSSLDSLINDSFFYSFKYPNSRKPEQVKLEYLFHADANKDHKITFNLSEVIASESSALVLDIWGRSSSLDRDNDFTVTFFDMNNNILSQKTSLTIPDRNPYYNRFVFDSFKAGNAVSKMVITSNKSYFTLAEIRLSIRDSSN